MQNQLTQLNTNMERLIEQIASANNHRYGRSSEKLDVIAGQLYTVDHEYQLIL
ncbi:transposase [[Clostridium] scindens]|uniref:transposase n=1 Tax=Clostridium scindens (strain JCM 10418 / VPI 12708) TaxID=29347 RepID=UPI00267511F6|nr:transposase [[Clostridium] scindens]